VLRADSPADPPSSSPTTSSPQPTPTASRNRLSPLPSLPRRHADLAAEFSSSQHAPCDVGWSSAQWAVRHRSPWALEHGPAWRRSRCRFSMRASHGAIRRRPTRCRGRYRVGQRSAESSGRDRPNRGRGQEGGGGRTMGRPATVPLSGHGQNSTIRQDDWSLARPGQVHCRGRGATASERAALTLMGQVGG